MDKPICDKALDLLQEYCDTRFNGNIRAMTVFLGMDPDNGMLHRWLKKRNPTLAGIGPCLDKIGAVLLGPDERPRAPVGKQVPDVAALQEELDAVKQERDQVAAQNYVLQGKLDAYKSLLDDLLRGEFDKQPGATITQSGKGNHLSALNSGR